jgi:hypothetical protein
MTWQMISCRAVFIFDFQAAVLPLGILVAVLVSVVAVGFTGKESWDKPVNRASVKNRSLDTNETHETTKRWNSVSRIPMGWF